MAKVTFYSEADLVFADKPTNSLFEDLTGRKFNRLTVLGYAGKSDHDRIKFYCRCECGRITKVLSTLLKAGKTGSCGCWQAESRHYHTKKHGHCTQDFRSRTFGIWAGMRGRCNNPNDHKYPDYGGRGIRVCERWNDYENFLSDMKECPGKDYSIDRIDNNGNYEPTNCRWATSKEQGRNKRNNRLLTYKGKTQPMSQWAEELGINFKTIHGRLERGWSDSDTLSIPPRKIIVWRKRA